MADQKERQIQEARALQQAVADISAKREAVQKEVSDMQAELNEASAKAQQLQQRQSAIAGEISQKSMQLKTIQAEMYKAESEYMACLEAQPSLVHVMKQK
mmetsp:Transcript_18979/g.35597  ORF Transcript_18979/g.35597 Transcript_18979/m.35597 type:complete len:100 (+) Transcript_18979:50-349(+)